MPMTHEAGLQELALIRRGRKHNFPMLRVHAAMSEATRVAELVAERPLTGVESFMVTEAAQRVIDIFEDRTKRIILCPHNDAVLRTDGEALGECPTHGKVLYEAMWGLGALGGHLAVVFYAEHEKLPGEKSAANLAGR